MNVSAVFDWAGDGPKVAGVHDPSVRWNGWACPRFTLETVRDLAAWIDAQGDDDYERVIVTDNGRVFMTKDDEGWTSEVPADADGLYGVGAYAWVWSEVE